MSMKHLEDCIKRYPRVREEMDESFEWSGNELIAMFRAFAMPDDEEKPVDWNGGYHATHPKPKARRMKGNPACANGLAPHHAVDHDESPGCAVGRPCQPVDCQHEAKDDRPAPPTPDQIPGFELTGEYREPKLWEYFYSSMGYPTVCRITDWNKGELRWILRKLPPKPAPWVPWVPKVGEWVWSDLEGLLLISKISDLSNSNGAWIEYTRFDSRNPVRSACRSKAQFWSKCRPTTPEEMYRPGAKVRYEDEVITVTGVIDRVDDEAEMRFRGLSGWFDVAHLTLLEPAKE